MKGMKMRNRFFAKVLDKKLATLCVISAFHFINNRMYVN